MEKKCDRLGSDKKTTGGQKVTLGNNKYKKATEQMDKSDRLGNNKYKKTTDGQKVTD